VEDRIKGAYHFLTKSFAGSDQGLDGETIVLEGVWLIHSMSLTGYTRREWEYAEFGVKPVQETDYVLITSGPLSYISRLTWEGRLLLRGSWTLRARIWTNSAHGQSARWSVICEKLEEAG
jgi:hypothetical protein